MDNYEVLEVIHSSKTSETIILKVLTLHASYTKVLF